MLVPAAVSAASRSFTAVALIRRTMARRRFMSAAAWRSLRGSPYRAADAGDPDRGAQRPGVAAAGGHRRAGWRGPQDRRPRGRRVLPGGAAVARLLPAQAGSA